MMAEYKDGHFHCTFHGDLGEHDQAIEREIVLYSGEDQLDGYFCMECLGNEVEMARIELEAEDYFSSVEQS